MLREDQWEKIDRKYGMLMHKISHQISGDTATSSFDDNLQDIRLSAMEAVMGFEKQNEGANGKFDEFWGSKGFDKYIKTCMWTKKNNKGAKITKKAPILKGTVSTDREEILQIEADCGDSEAAIMLEQISYLLTPSQKSIIHKVVEDPTLVKPSGKINIKRVSEELQISWFEADKHLRKLSKILENDL